MLVEQSGIKETCDGSGLPIQDVYYLEVIIKENIDPEFISPSVKDVEVAKKNGYIMIDPKENYLGIYNGLNTKVRAWVKPDPLGFSVRGLTCRWT